MNREYCGMMSCADMDLSGIRQRPFRSVAQKNQCHRYNFKMHLYK